MKKSLLALAVLGAFAGAAQAQSSVTIYGIVDTGITYTSKVGSVAGTPAATATGSRFGLNSGILQGSRIGFKGVEDLGGGLSAVFNLETGFQNDTGAMQGADATTSSSLFRRKSVVGLQGGFGAVLAGRQTDFLDDIGGSMTGVGDFGGVISNVGSGLSRLQGTRTNNSVRYNTNNLGGFTGSLIYGFGETAGSASAGQAWGLGGKYENGPLALAAAYYQSKANGAGNNANAADTGITSTTTNSAYSGGNISGTVLKTWTLAAAYQIGAAKIYGNWSRVKQPGAFATGYGSFAAASAAPSNFLATTSGTVTANTGTNTGYVIGGSNMDKADLFELGGNYALSPSLKLLASVQHSRLNFVGADSKGKLTQINLGTDYWLSKRTDIYAFLSNLRASNTYNPGIGASSIGGAPSGADASQTAVSVGIRHKF